MDGVKRTFDVDNTIANFALLKNEEVTHKSPLLFIFVCPELNYHKSAKGKAMTCYVDKSIFCLQQRVANFCCLANLKREPIHRTLLPYTYLHMQTHAAEYQIKTFLQAVYLVENYLIIVITCITAEMEFEFVSEAGIRFVQVYSSRFIKAPFKKSVL